MKAKADALRGTAVVSSFVDLNIACVEQRAGVAAGSHRVFRVARTAFRYSHDCCNGLDTGADAQTHCGRDKVGQAHERSLCARPV